MSNDDLPPLPPLIVQDKQPFWASRRFWGLLIAFAGSVLPLMGVGDTATINNLGNAGMNAVDAIMQFGGLALAFWGSVSAKKPLAFRFRR